MNLTMEQKADIRLAMMEYIGEHDLTAEQFAQKADLNASYMNRIYHGYYELDNKQKTVIADKWFMRIAQAIGYEVNKTFWSMKPTAQTMRILATMSDAREHGYTRILIGETGCGKTYTINEYKVKTGTDVYSVKVGSSDNLGDLLDKVGDAMRISMGRTKSRKIRDIINALRGMKEAGKKPLMVFDECEFMKVATICAVKELYDELVNVCGIVLVGTKQFWDNLLKLVRRDKPGMRQFYRRVKFGFVELDGVDKSFELFLDDSVPSGVKKFVREHCDNYGELHDALVPCLREAERLEQPLTVELMKMVLGIK